MMNKRTMIVAAVGLFGVRAIWRRIKSRGDLRDKTVLVTGGSRGLGLLLAREFGYEGCRVAICARDREELDQAAARLREWGVGDVRAVRCDVSDRADVAQLIETLEDYFGPIDILVNNAGVIQVGPVTSQTVDDFQEAMEIMFWGGVYPTLVLLPQMLRRNRGHIVNITSIGGKASVPHLLPYNTAKFAATGFSEGLGAELAGKGVRVTTVVPGLMRTGSYLNAFFKGQHEDEFRWFSVAGNLPFITIDAERAARRIVRAVKRGDTEITLTFPAQLLARLYGMFPGTMLRLFGLVNRLVLPAGDNFTKKRGMDIQPQAQSPLFNFLTGMGKSAARRFNQYSAESETVRLPQTTWEN